MSEPRAHRLRQLFDAALERSPCHRADFLDSACGSDTDLKQRVRAMLAAAAPEAVAPRPEGPGTRIGPYKLLQQIGEGGAGVVFLAEQDEPVQRRVAIRIVTGGLDPRQVLARFEQEREALAVMDHPNIARVLDAGTTASGRPYFVMELVKGAPIVDYCDQNQLSIDERLELFARVCEAVQHAHGKGILHRDLKPANVLVGTLDGRPMAKVVDFGIARATALAPSDRTPSTARLQVFGTLPYRSPEQLEGSLDIDTRSDVYALGVMLYELSTGRTPFDAATIHGARSGEPQGLRRETEPTCPSARLGQSRDTLASIAASRRVAPERLVRMLRGGLDWIVLRALARDRTRRYATAHGLALDVRRFLAGEAVLAASPGAGHRLRTLVRRHRSAATAVVLVVVALLVGVVAFAWRAGVARAQRDFARTSEQAARQAEAAAVAKADLAEAQAIVALGAIQQIVVRTSGLQVPGTEGYRRGLLDLALAAVGTVADIWERHPAEPLVVTPRPAGQLQVDHERRLARARCFARCAQATPADQPDLASGFRRAAVQQLRAAIGHGYRDHLQLTTHPDLAPLQAEPEFQALVAKLVGPR